MQAIVSAVASLLVLPVFLATGLICPLLFLVALGWVVDMAGRVRGRGGAAEADRRRQASDPTRG